MPEDVRGSCVTLSYQPVGEVLSRRVCNPRCRWCCRIPWGWRAAPSQRWRSTGNSNLRSGSPSRRTAPGRVSLSRAPDRSSWSSLPASSQSSAQRGDDMLADGATRAPALDDLEVATRPNGFAAEEHAPLGNALRMCRIRRVSSIHLCTKAYAFASGLISML
jgi:hypothetical protein